MKFGDFLKNISTSTNNIMDGVDPFIENEYAPFLVNRSFSYHPDTIFYANEANGLSVLDKKLQYDYLFYSVRKRKRFARWSKTYISEKVKLIKEYYKYNTRRALEVESLFTKADINKIKKELDKGGTK